MLRTLLPARAPLLARTCTDDHITMFDFADDYCKYYNDRYEETEHSEWDRADALSSLRQSIYHLYIREWLKTFPPGRFLVLKSEEYNQDVIGTIRKTVFPFLQLADYDVTECMKAKPKKKVISRLASNGLRDIDLNYSQLMLPKTWNLLVEFYRPHNQKLAQLLGDTRWLW